MAGSADGLAYAPPVKLEPDLQDPGEWDAFATAHPGASLAHAAGWSEVLRRAYRLPVRRLAAREDSGHLAGILPLVPFRGLSGRRELVSMPFLDTGGVAAGPEAVPLLRDGALGLAAALGARAVELRQPAPVEGLGGPSPGVDRVDLVLELEADPEAQWRRVGPKVRNQTRKAERSGLELAPSGWDLPAAFYGPYATNMRDLGSPPHALAFFRAIAEVFGEAARFVVARDGLRSVGGLVAIHFGDTVTVPWASTLRSERSRCPNNLIYWEALRWAIARGARRLDFGRSPRESGSFRFKRGWGAVARPLAWTRLDPSGRVQPWRSTRGAAAGRLAAVWSRLPVPVATAAGSRLRRFIAS